ncbi:MAG: hypothetical protein KGL43_23355 [Burkholderiales bacterium]|nr:hypothetical protein [Burkholderiales bacterium]MDE2456534.1 hypothetical protein [Burkholderiales bacterium]
MRQVQIPFTMPACALAASLLVSACGGGGASAPAVTTPALTAQTISFASPGNQTVGGAVPALAATASSGLAVSYASNSTSVCTVSGNAVSLLAAGSCSITASQAGDATYAAATPVTDTFGVAAAAAPQAQTISFTSPGNQTLGTAPAALAATSSSGLAVTIASTTPTVCTVTGTMLTLVSAGQCTLTATQSGNASYAAATPVTDGFTVAAAPATVSTLTFSSGFAAANLTVEGGSFGGYSGSNLDGYNCGAPAACGSGGSFTPTVTAANSGFYYYYQTPSPAAGEYVGVFVQAPGLTTGISGSADTPGVQIAGQTTMKFSFGENPEWFASATHNFGVMLTLGKHYTTSGSCNIKLLAVVTPTAAAATNYSIPLSSFAVTQNCAVSTLTVAQALAMAPISQIDFQGDGGAAALPTVNGLTTGANLSVANTASPPVYPTTLVVNGAITFQ